MAMLDNGQIPYKSNYVRIFGTICASCARVPQLPIIRTKEALCMKNTSRI